MPEQLDPTPEIIEALGRQAFDNCVLRARLRALASVPAAPIVPVETQQQGNATIITPPEQETV